jgi:flagellar hook-associated protein 3 FlgL
MTLNSIGDLANNLMLRTRNTALKTQMNSLNEALADGKTKNLDARLAGNYAYLEQLDHDLLALEGYRVTMGEASLMVGSAGETIDRVNSLLGTLQNRLIAPFQLTAITREALAEEARGMINSTISNLNMEVGGRKVFSGIDTDIPPLENSDTLLTAIAAEISGQTTAADVIAATDAWLDSPIGFDAVMYNGSAQTLSEIRIGFGDFVEMPILANDDRFKAAFKAMALISLLPDSGLAFDMELQKDIYEAVLPDLVGDQSKLVNLQAEMGLKTERLSVAQTEITSRLTTMEYARGALLAADPYETAVELQSVQVQIDSFYATLARSSQLSLVNYL